MLDYARHLLQQLTSPLPQSSTFCQVDGLSQRQQQILRLIAQGLSNEQIAERLFVAPSTIKTHINHLYAKLGVNNRSRSPGGGAPAFGMSHPTPSLRQKLECQP